MFPVPHQNPSGMNNCKEDEMDSSEFMPEEI